MVNFYIGVDHVDYLEYQILMVSSIYGISLKLKGHTKKITSLILLNFIVKNINLSKSLVNIEKVTTSTNLILNTLWSILIIKFIHK